MKGSFASRRGHDPPGWESPLYCLGPRGAYLPSPSYIPGLSGRWHQTPHSETKNSINCSTLNTLSFLEFLLTQAPGVTQTQPGEMQNTPWVSEGLLTSSWPSQGSQGLRTTGMTKPTLWSVCRCSQYAQKLSTAGSSSQMFTVRVCSPTQTAYWDELSPLPSSDARNKCVVRPTLSKLFSVSVCCFIIPQCPS